MLCNVCDSIRVFLISFTIISTLHQLPYCDGLVSTRHRIPRGITLFGTRWCGYGDSARHFGDLGRHRRTDVCCRTHDKCKYSIPAFRRKWTLLNLSLATISHCDCDKKFHECLKRVNTAVAKAVGSLFFNVLQPMCFKFQNKRVCVKRRWWFWCDRYDFEKTAVIQTNNFF